MSDRQRPFEFALVGGGLANSLIALALLERRPETRLILIERESRIGGEHTWCFHERDVSEGLRSVVEDLVEFRWPGYEVRFPGLTRRLDSPYRGFGAERLAERVEQAFARAPHGELRKSTSASSIAPHVVELEGGERLEADWVIDARGPQPSEARGRAGYQIFLGRELELAAEHGLERPLVMDATVEQEGGYRFVYVLPLGPSRLLVEDTVFADGPELDEERFGERLDDYVRAAGWTVQKVIRDERGVLPMEFSGKGPAIHQEGLLQAGYAGGWVHPATGYSFPVAARLAAQLAACGEPGECLDALRPLAQQIASQSRFGRVLNRLLFRWFPPTARVDIFRRFYRLPDDLIARFYALRMLRRDQFRILVGRPPRGMSFQARRSAARRLS